MCMSIDAGDELVMVDAGFGPGPDEILDLMRADGLDPARVSRIVITHYHADHAGGCAGMVRATGAELWAPVEAADTIRTADADQIGLTWAQSFGFYPADYVWEACEVAHEFSDGDRIPAGDLDTRGGLDARPLRRTLRAAAAGTRPHAICSRPTSCSGAGRSSCRTCRTRICRLYADSMNRALELEFDALLPGHHVISLRNGHRHVEAAANDFNRIGLPRDLLR